MSETKSERVWRKHKAGDLLYTGPEGCEHCLIVTTPRPTDKDYRYIKVLHNGRVRCVEEWWNGERFVLSRVHDR